MIKNFTVAVSIIIMLSGIMDAQTNYQSLSVDWNNGGGNPQKNYIKN